MNKPHTIYREIFALLNICNVFLFTKIYFAILWFPFLTTSKVASQICKKISQNVRNLPVCPIYSNLHIVILIPNVCDSLNYNVHVQVTGITCSFDNLLCMSLIFQSVCESVQYLNTSLFGQYTTIYLTFEMQYMEVWFCKKIPTISNKSLSVYVYVLSINNTNNTELFYVQLL